jgi:hypothetical protein
MIKKRLNKTNEQVLNERSTYRVAARHELIEGGIEFTEHNNGAHLVIFATTDSEPLDFWPGTQLWMERKTKTKHHGIESLLTHVKALREVKK